MSRKNAVMALGMALGMAAFVACSGGEGGSQEAAAGAMAEGQESAAAGVEQQMELPEGVTMEMVNQGQEVYAGAGLCYVCHGAEGQGMPGLGANLTDDEWVHGDGSFDALVTTVMDGVDSGASTTGTAMPPKGGSGISDEQVRQVAAYVWTLSQ
ncbi:MAG: c-type cytochrome [Gemmatimonadetes bacterium]|nr:c-type cytochrome [Gemmatimonadota bacterium]NIO32322.1 c-type cytochrome [Gemmatimonadota bacterium]